ncbi:MAG: class I SAM-dependent methyltransferase [Terriglobia bacterium]
MPSNPATYFDCVIPWEKRLARETPLLEELSRKAGRRILFPACGTGGHVVALAELGFEVLGIDIDEDALAIARKKIAAARSPIAACGGHADVQILDMANGATLGPIYDAAFCLGNALPGLSAPGQLLAALRGIAGALRPGGVFFTQNLNYDRRWKEKTKFFPVLSGQTPDEEVLLVKFAEYEPEFINFHAMFLARPKSGGAWQSYPRSSRQIPLFRERMIELLSQAGFGESQFWGDYAKTPFDVVQSPDLIILTEKA